jgi:serine/threonine protein kinase
VDPGSPVGVVQYLIFERAENDIRKHLNLNQNLDLAWRLRTIHQVAIGLQQLHGQDIAHQDLKPSNVLLVREVGGKLSDLGCAAIKSSRAPRDHLEIAGDHTYAPPELLYHFAPSDWDARRFGCDLYLLGSMLAFVFATVSMTHLVLAKLHPSMHPGRWTDTYVAVLPYLRDAVDQAVTDTTTAIPPQVRGDLEVALRQLCDPDPSTRGHPLTRAQVGNPYSLQRYVSLLDLLSRKAEANLI